ncbi:MAG: hypothetical protein H6825_15610 [Planctomycetes bacterium]|nr:hypothetical protein [Planctomycetota bacterium]
MSRGAWRHAAILALAGMLAACGLTRPVVEASGDDLRLDRLWLALERGDVEGASGAAAEVHAPGFAERARFDALALAEGRVAALTRAREQGSFWRARFLASDARAREVLDEVPESQRGLAYRLEDARLSPPQRRASIAGALVESGAGGTEALAVWVEALLAQGRLADADALLDAGPSTARLRAARHRLELATGRVRSGVRGLLDDLGAGLLTTSGLQLLERALQRVPMDDLEAEARRLLRADGERGERYERTRTRVLAGLELRAGHAREGVAQLARLDVRDPVDDRLARRVRRRAGLPVPDDDGRPPTPEERVDADPQRVGGRALLELRTADEWSLAARATYHGALVDGDELDLDGFTAALDAAGAHLGDGVPRLAELPRRGFGLFGELLDTTGLAEALPDAFVLAGEGFLLPPELTLYDRVASASPDLVGDDGEHVRYTRQLVQGMRVPGLQASRGADFSGAGLVDVVFLDADQVLRQARRPASPLAPLPPEAWPARDTAERRALDEPLDTAERLLAAARADAGDDFARRVLEALALHEERHILDVQHLLARNVFGMLLDVLSAGGTPDAVRAEVERRAQLDAIRRATDPRLPLAHVIASLRSDPGLPGVGEHAAGYGELLAQLVEVLDEERWDGARPLSELGIDRGRVLVQQLWRLDPETLRALAMAVAL